MPTTTSTHMKLDDQRERDGQPARVGLVRVPVMVVVVSTFERPTGRRHLEHDTRSTTAARHDRRPLRRPRDPKLFGWFDGPGSVASADDGEAPAAPPKRHAVAAGVSRPPAERCYARRAHPLATTALTATMVTAIRKVHAEKGPWVTSGGYESTWC